MPGTFDVEVESLAKEQRTYSRAFDSNIEALGQLGGFDIAIGETGGEHATIDIQPGDSLEGIAAKINESGIRVTASVFYDGSSYRLQVRGLDTGAANALTFTEMGTNFDLNGDGSDPDGGKTYQAASDASVLIDGFTVTRPTNQISGAIPGVTLALTAETTESATITIAPDSEELRENVQAVVTAFNSIISGVHLAAGFGDIEATNEELAGDYALRTVTDRLGSVMHSLASEDGTFRMLADIGLSLSSSGTMSLDATKLEEAVAQDAAGVAAVLAEKMTVFEELVEDMTDTDTGVFTLRQDSLESQLDELDERTDREQDWLDRYAESMRKRFTAMDVEVGTMMANLDQLLNIES